MKTSICLWYRVVLVPLLLVALVTVARQVRLFYADVAPFHQMYLLATPAQDAAVTKRLLMAHFLFPGLVLALLLVLAPSVVLRNARRFRRILGLFFLLAGLQGCATVARLPYGFGSSYEHASAAQHHHLALAGWTGILGIGIAVLLFIISFGRATESTLDS